MASRGNSEYKELPLFCHRDWVFLGLTNTAGGLGGAPPVKVLGNFREVLNCDKSTELEYFSNDNSIKKRHEMEIGNNKLSYMRLSFETQFKIEFFYHHLLVVKNA